MKGIFGFILIGLVIVGFLLLFPGKEYPPLPNDDTHRAAVESACMTCHGPGKANALKQSHPPKFECGKCHKTKR